MRDKPELQDVPMAVITEKTIASVNTEARDYGVVPTMSAFIAKKLCPSLQMIFSTHDKYEEDNETLKSIVKIYDSSYESATLD